LLLADKGVLIKTNVFSYDLNICNFIQFFGKIMKNKRLLGLTYHCITIHSFTLTRNKYKDAILTGHRGWHRWVVLLEVGKRKGTPPP
jgi:hypothetical protein